MSRHTGIVRRCRITIESLESRWAPSVAGSGAPLVMGPMPEEVVAIIQPEWVVVQDPSEDTVSPAQGEPFVAPVPLAAPPSGLDHAFAQRERAILESLDLLAETGRDVPLLRVLWTQRACSQDASPESRPWREPTPFGSPGVWSESDMVNDPLTVVVMQETGEPPLHHRESTLEDAEDALTSPARPDPASSDPAVNDPASSEREKQPTKPGSAPAETSAAADSIPRVDAPAPRPETLALAPRFDPDRVVEPATPAGHWACLGALAIPMRRDRPSSGRRTMRRR